MPANQNNAEDLQQMQQEAIRRVKEMQARAHLQPDPPLPQRERHEQQERREHSEHQEERHGPVVALPDSQLPLKSIETIFESLMKDSDRTLILILILILMGEEADISLVFALMYLVI